MSNWVEGCWLMYSGCSLGDQGSDLIIANQTVELVFIGRAKTGFIVPWLVSGAGCVLFLGKARLEVPVRLNRIDRIENIKDDVSV